jgi:hypothetical protein
VLDLKKSITAFFELQNLRQKIGGTKNWRHKKLAAQKIGGIKIAREKRAILNFTHGPQG